MNPREYYHLKTAQITEADVRLVAACMTEHKPDPLKDVPYVSLSNAEIAAMTPDHPLYKLVKGDGKCKDE